MLICWRAICRWACVGGEGEKKGGARVGSFIYKKKIKLGGQPGVCQ